MRPGTAYSKIHFCKEVLFRKQIRIDETKHQFPKTIQRKYQTRNHFNTAQKLDISSTARSRAYRGRVSSLLVAHPRILQCLSFKERFEYSCDSQGLFVVSKAFLLSVHVFSLIMGRTIRCVEQFCALLQKLLVVKATYCRFFYSISIVDIRNSEIYP